MVQPEVVEGDNGCERGVGGWAGDLLLRRQTASPLDRCL